MINKYSFSTFSEGIDFLEEKRKEGHEGIYYPEGGDKPRQMTTETPRHIVLIVPAPESKEK